jgi:hypothetical protein
MGYFDALTSSSFKTKDDGQQLFFPWGILGCGYAIPSETEFDRLRRTVKAYLVICLPLTFVFVSWKGLLGGAVILPLLIVPYVVWVQSRCRRLQRTKERLTLAESMAGQARLHSAVVLWLLEFATLVFVGIGALILILDPTKWPLAVASIGMFGFSAVVFARMLLIKRGERRPRL